MLQSSLALQEKGSRWSVRPLNGVERLIKGWNHDQHIRVL